MPVPPRPEFVAFCTWLTDACDELLPGCMDGTERRKLMKLRQTASGDFSKPRPSWLRSEQDDRVALRGTA